MYYAKIGLNNSGFTNQIFSLVSSILSAHYKNEKVVVVDNFLNDFSKNAYTPISKIFNLDKINVFLKKKYNIIIVDRYDISFELLKVKYGTLEKNIDITEPVKNNFLSNNILFIPKGTNLDEIDIDPCPFVVKNLYFNYKINNYFIEEELNNLCFYLSDNIIIDWNNSHYEYMFKWINSINKEYFEDIITNIEYNDFFIQLSNNFLKNINLKNKINVIHLRLEDDAIQHWSKQNEIPEENFKNYIVMKYIELIIKYTNPTDQNIILSQSLSNGVIDFLKSHNYIFKMTDKNFDEREKNAIVDFLIAKNCNNIFIGNFNFKNLNGSTFSYYIQQTLPRNVIKINIDLDKIFEDEVVG